MLRRLPLILLFSPLFLHAQKPPIIKFDYIQKLFDHSSDTLYVINFWATWCKPCVEELPAFEAIHTQFPGARIRVILVSLDFASDYQRRLIPFLKKNPQSSEVFLLNEPKYNTWIGKVDENWGGAIPVTVFVRGTAGTRSFHEGEFTSEELHAEIARLLK